MARRSKYHPYILLTLAILVGALGTSIRFAAISHSPLHNAKTISFTATVKSDPVVGRKRVVGSHLRGGSTTFLATLDHGAIDGKEYSLHLPVRISSTKSVNFLPGTHISGSGTVFATSERRVAALISTRSTLVQIESTDPINAISGEIRRSFKASALTIGGASGALIPGLVLGDTSLEKAQFVEDMRRSGLTHLTAVSGENFAIIAAFILWALAFFVRSMRIRILITASILIAFIGITCWQDQRGERVCTSCPWFSYWPIGSSRPFSSNRPRFRAICERNSRDFDRIRSHRALSLALYRPEQNCRDACHSHSCDALLYSADHGDLWPIEFGITSRQSLGF